MSRRFLFFFSFSKISRCVFLWRKKKEKKNGRRHWLRWARRRHSYRVDANLDKPIAPGQTGGAVRPKVGGRWVGMWEGKKRNETRRKKKQKAKKKNNSSQPGLSHPQFLQSGGRWRRWDLCFLSFFLSYILKATTTLLLLPLAAGFVSDFWGTPTDCVLLLLPPFLPPIFCFSFLPGQEEEEEEILARCCKAQHSTQLGFFFIFNILADGCTSSRQLNSCCRWVQVCGVRLYLPSLFYSQRSQSFKHWRPTVCLWMCVCVWLILITCVREWVVQCSLGSLLSWVTWVCPSVCNSCLPACLPACSYEMYADSSSPPANNMARQLHDAEIHRRLVLQATAARSAQSAFNVVAPQQQQHFSEPPTKGHFQFFNT